MAGPMVGSADFKSVGGPESRSAVGSIPTHSRHFCIIFSVFLWGDDQGKYLGGKRDNIKVYSG